MLVLQLGDDVMAIADVGGGALVLGEVGWCFTVGAADLSYLLEGWEHPLVMLEFVHTPVQPVLLLDIPILG